MKWHRALGVIAAAVLVGGVGPGSRAAEGVGPEAAAADGGLALVPPTPPAAHVESEGAPSKAPPAHVESNAVLPEVQVTYLERCGGCHGIQGHSAPGEVPRLQGQVSSFLCLPEGRDYLVRLPSVALSPLPDDELASLMNFVVFDLGAVPADRARFPPYTAAEVGALRKQPLNEVALVGYRAAIVKRLIRQCGAPSSLRDYVSARAEQ